MRRFFVDEEAIEGGNIRITGEIMHHIGHVLRLSVGEQITACTGDGKVYLVELTEFGKTEISGRILQMESQTCETSAAVTLYQGLPKGDKLELIIQKCTELGISRVVPVFTERSVVKLEPARGEKKVERWKKIAIEASQQSQRVMVPEITAPVSWKQMIGQLDESSLTLVMWEDETTLGLKHFLETHELQEKINLIIGPEGGLTEEEVSQLQDCGAYSVTLGKRILRTETAGLAALTMLLYHLGDLG